MTKTDSDYELTTLVLSRMTFLTLKEKLFLLNKLDSLYDLVIQSIEDISKNIHRASKAVWNGKAVLKDAERDRFILQKLGISKVLYTDNEYPLMLKEISDPPFMLFYRGNIGILNERTVSVVGTRRMTADSAAACRQFAKDAALDGVTVVSGLAYGIDRKAHEGALEAADSVSAAGGAESLRDQAGRAIGKTAAVIPAGIDTIVPYAHTKLASRILDGGGCILSEYPPGAVAMPYMFVQRNRIIAGLSPATVVIQAPVGSGAMLTAEFAMDYGREVIFHQAAFTESSRRISDFSRRQIENSVRCGKNEEYKLKNDPELYVRDGAPVIQDYQDFCRYINDSSARVPDQKLIQAQPELFSCLA